jgi:hypothetical protein
MAIIVPILSTFDPAGINKAQRAFKGLSGTAKTASIAFAGLGVAVGKFGYDSVKAAAEDQKAQLKLAKTLQNVTGATDAQTAAVEKFITAQQFATGVSDSQLRPALENLVRATGDVNKAQGLLKLGLDISAGSGRDLSIVSLGLTRALGGNFASLSKLGIVIPDNIKKSKDFAKVQEYLNTLFGGQAAVAAGTFQGKLEILKQRLQEAQETIGAKLIPILTNLVDYFLNNVVPAIERVANGGFKQLVIEIANTFSGLTGVAKIAKEVAFAFIGIKIALVAFAIAPPLIAAVTSALTTMRIAALYGAAGFKVLGVAIKGALASSGIGLLVIGVGLVVGKIIEMGIESKNTTDDIVILGKTATTRFGAMEAAANRLVIKMDEVSVAARHASDTLENNRLVPRSKVNYDVKAQKDAEAAAKATSNSAIKSSKATSDAQKKAQAIAKAAADAAKKAAAEMAKVVAAASKLATAALTKMNDKLTIAREKLKAAKDAYKEFKAGIRDSITGLLNFGDAASQTTGTFLENLRKQVTGAVGFADKVKQLIAMGLSETGIQQVLAAGAVAGTKIADELIAGGAGAINETNALVASLTSAAETLATAGASQFYKAGITQGQAMVDGIIASIKKAGFIMSGGKAALPKPLQTALNKGKLTSGQASELMGIIGNSQAVTAPASKSGTGTTINVTVNAGMGANGTTIGRDIVDAIKKYERVSGPVFLSA